MRSEPASRRSPIAPSDQGEYHGEMPGGREGEQRGPGGKDTYPCPGGKDTTEKILTRGVQEPARARLEMLDGARPLGSGQPH